MDKSEWQGPQGDTWAAEWRRTDRSFGLLTERLLSRLRSLNPRQVLDIGCGAGELSLAIARGHPDAEVTGVDISAQLIDTAKSRGSNLDNVRFICADAAEWQSYPGFFPDLLVSRHGVMFFDEPIAAFANLASMAKPGAQLVFSCFRDPAENPFMTEIMKLLPAPPAPADPRAPGPFAFADSDYVEGLLQQAGWTETSFERVDFAMVTGAGENPISDATEYFSKIGPAARAISQMGLEEREAFLCSVSQVAERNLRDGIVALPASAWIVTAERR